MKDLFYPCHPPIKGAKKIIREQGINPRAEQLRAYYLANRDKVRQKQREYYEANRERMLERVSQYKAENPEKVRAAKRNSERYRNLQKAGRDNPPSPAPLPPNP